MYRKRSGRSTLSPIRSWNYWTSFADPKPTRQDADSVDNPSFRIAYGSSSMSYRRLIQRLLFENRGHEIDLPLIFCGLLFDSVATKDLARFISALVDLQFHRREFISTHAGVDTVSFGSRASSFIIFLGVMPSWWIWMQSYGNVDLNVQYRHHYQSYRTVKAIWKTQPQVKCETAHFTTVQQISHTLDFGCSRIWVTWILNKKHIQLNDWIRLIWFEFNRNIKKRRDFCWALGPCIETSRLGKNTRQIVVGHNFG